MVPVVSVVDRTVELAPRPSSAAEARRVVSLALRDADPAMRDIGVLLASELVTNALLYAQGRIALHVAEVDDGFRITVRDDKPLPVGPRRVALDATSGRGLTLVEHLARTWGVDVQEPEGKEVWFEVPRHR
jgi:anti-sigma regulatory factor (Ser/Thr protein kinase)